MRIGSEQPVSIGKCTPRFNLLRGIVVLPRIGEKIGSIQCPQRTLVGINETVADTFLEKISPGVNLSGKFPLQTYAPVDGARFLEGAVVCSKDGRQRSADRSDS